MALMLLWVCGQKWGRAKRIMLGKKNSLPCRLLGKPSLLEKDWFQPCCSFTEQAPIWHYINTSDQYRYDGQYFTDYQHCA